MADALPSFEQVLGSSLFALPRTSGDAGWCGYLVRQGDAPPAGPLTIVDAFSVCSGHFLFAPTAPPLATPDDVQRFTTGVWDYLSRSFGGPTGKFTGTAFAWIPDPLTPAFGPAGGYAFRYSDDRLATDFNSHVGTRLTLSIGSGVALGATDTGLTLRGQVAAHVAFVADQQAAAPAIAPDAAELPCVGPYSGCLVFGGTLVPAVTLPFFAAGLRYVHPVASGGRVSQVYPVLATARTAPLPYAGALDPLDPLNAGPAADRVNGRMRTLLAPTAAGGSPPLLDAWLRTSMGLATSLAPIGGADASGRPAIGAGAFVFETRGPAGDTSADVYLTFAGDWGIAVEGAPLSGPGAGAGCDLLCGVDGLERIAFRAYAEDATYDRLRFVPGCAAYAARFPFDAASIAALAGTEPLLDQTHRTPWATVASGDATPVTYLAQPSSSPLYEVVPAVATSIFDWYRTTASLPQQAGFAVPLVPYAGVAQAPSGFPAAELPAFETEVIAPSRKARIAPSTLGRLRAARAARLTATAQAGSAVATSPQGFLVELAGETYAKVTLARSSAPADLAFQDVTAELQNLLQTNQLFAVLVDPKHVGAAGPAASSGTPTFDDQVTMAQWTLAADLGRGSTASDYRNVVIFKFCDGSLRDRVETPHKWTDARDFSLLASEPDTPDDVRLSGLSQWLRDYVAAAIAESEAGNALYSDFARLATDPSWNGIVVLRADVTGVPDQLQGLMAGIDTTQLLAHHFGVTVTPVTAGATVPDVRRSSLFGLVDYQLPLYRENVASGGSPDTPLGLEVDGDYGFTVLQLQALFRNAALVDFRSRVQLTVERLFGSPVAAAYGATGVAPATGVVLRGSYQSQGGKDAYVFEQDATTVFVLDDAILDAVAFGRVQWDTLGRTGAGAGEQIVSRVLVWGQLDFAALAGGGQEPFDLLSFGSAPGTPPECLGAGLSFSNLQIGLTSPAATPNVTTFAFDPSGLAFDVATSAPRQDSLFDSLALQLDGFVAAPARKRPADYGYLPVASAVPAAAFDGPWYGVVYKLTLGTPGALVAKAGFESRLLVGWAPAPVTGSAPGRYPVVTSISLPGGAPGAKLLSLQGVLKLSVQSIQLLRQEVAGHPGRRAFVLRLRNVGVRFLGIAKLPPGATIDFFLFGALEGTGSLGWYAAYRQDAAQQGVVAIEGIGAAP